MAGFWPTADSDPSSTLPMIEFARIWRDMPEFVFSRAFGNGVVLLRYEVPAREGRS